MVAMDPSSWNRPDHSLPPAADDDFNQFLDMGGMSSIGEPLHFDFQDFAASGPGPMMPSEPPRDVMDTAMSGVDAPCVNASSAMSMPSHLISTTAAGGPSVPSQILQPHQAPPNALSEIDAQIHFLQSQRFAEQHRQLEEQRRHLEEQQAAFYAQQQRNLVPPTPQSLEMQASSHFFTLQSQQQQQQQQQQRQRAGNSTPQHSHGMFDRYPRLKDQQDMSFTPLVSPAVTPLDTHFPVEARYTVPGAYFSPLTSPALHAQNPEAILNYEQNLHGSTATNSPVDMDLESKTPPPATTENTKKSRKSNVAKARKPTVRQSPITKPQRKKTASTPVINAQILSELAETAAERREHPSLWPAPDPLSTTSTEDSENASVSPETLSEMPPPPLPQPRSARQSPYIAAQPHATPMSHPLPAALNGARSPATPASLFRVSPKSKTPDASNPGQVASEHIENFELPESANFPASQPPQTSTRLESSFPKLDEDRIPSMAPLPSPGLSRVSQPPSNTTSPQLTPRPSSQRKTPLLAARSSKKRASISSVHVSPALLPRISPNLKPLLPGTPGMTAEDTASRLLTSKSNYQNILEGNKVPGVSYPSELSTNLTSKRTSHKIAEQGRRNRINSALQEIATLLPKSVLKENEEVVESPGSDKAGKKDCKQAGTPNSKANTVEMAIVYIKQLQQEVADANKRAEDAEAKLGAHEAAAVS